MAVEKKVLINNGEYDERGQLQWTDDPEYETEALPQAAVGRVSPRSNAPGMRRDGQV